jgi:hypothetical protein
MAIVRRNFFTIFAKINIYRAELKRSCKIFALLLVLFASSVQLNAGIKEDVEHLSDSLLQGRRPGSRGGAEAAAFIYRRFQQSGFVPRLQSFMTEKGVCRNVYVVCNGNPKSSKYTLVCAHFDGLGIYDGALYPGADSNASGVAVLLDVAARASIVGRNLIFVALDSHADGMAGAIEFAALPYKISMAVNLDTSGSTLAPPDKYRPDFLIALGGKEYEKQLEKANAGPRLRLYYDYYRSKAFTDYFYNKASDQVPFMRKGAKAVMFTSGIPMNTNKPDDGPETLDYEVLQRRSDLILTWIDSL